MSTILIKNANIVNEGKIFPSDLFIKNGFIEKIGDLDLSADQVIDAMGKYLFPGVIDDQVHFREPGLTHKANIATESKAALAGGTTSFMEMPNTVPNTLTQGLLEEKYQIAAENSWVNYSFFMGGSNNNYDEAMKTDLKNVCGLKLFMGSSTGNMLVDNPNTLDKIFSNFAGLIATHCEDEATVKANLEFYKEKYQNKDIPYDIHALIRNEEACYKSSSMAVNLAKKYDTRLHILHISTTEELELFSNDIPLSQKHLTSEVCVHHLFFDAEDYKKQGVNIKCNPAIKHNHRESLLEGLLDNHLDIIATDHAPHTWEEKSQDYWSAPSGLPLVQHSLQIMLDFYQKGKISLEKIVEKMCHAPAECFKVNRRGYIREGYWADLVLVDLNKSYTVDKDNILYKCGWSPLEGVMFGSSISKTIVSGELLFDEGQFLPKKSGKRLQFDR
ncbi:MAG: dihydroorotase [Cytophagaceae bacterium]|nr:dihydroorotase [Cytophagaceae bacterium]MBK9509448.1 dihydroorotase [Cytophagaceae bacterium]MBK9935126.1 dihydroorotase [Cytophagaceae bacterium]MBL0301570.1 dihydroorotase [Cytophagaceae bacterium]MBL0324394.1 dihydroorotase [Cytophagaceae bacterium]